MIARCGSKRETPFFVEGLHTLFYVWLTCVGCLSAVVLPHSVRRKNIAKRCPNNHPSHRRPIRQLEQCLRYEWCKHSGQPHKRNAQRFAPTEIGQDIDPVSPQIFAKISHPFSLPPTLKD